MRGVGAIPVGAALLLAFPPAVGGATLSTKSRCCFHASVHVSGSMLVDYGSDPAAPATGRQEMAWDWRAREIVRFYPRGGTADGRVIPRIQPVRRKRTGRPLWHDDLPSKVRYRFRESSSITTQGIDGVQRAPEQRCVAHRPHRSETATSTPDRVEFASKGWRRAPEYRLPVFGIERSVGNHPAVPPGRTVLVAYFGRVLPAWDAYCGPGGWAHVPGEDHGDPLHAPGLAPWHWIQVSAPATERFRRSRRITRTVTWRVAPPVHHDQPPHVTTQQLRATFTFTWFHPKRLRSEVRRFLAR